MTRSAASQRQVLAAEPRASTWLSANAGSGKTRVLTDRVARLLLGGTEPQHILCLTYTKAAASEMQNRLFRRLGEWAMLEEGRLRAALAELGIDGVVSAETLAEARRLFARAIETPGGLRIQTIHSFCAGLLRRFPLEAGVSPDFTEMDDRAAELLRAEIVEELAGGADIGAVDALAGLVAGDDLSPVLGDLCRNSDAFAKPLTRPAALELFDLPPGHDRATLRAEVLMGDEAALLAELVPLLLASGANDRKAGERLASLDMAETDCLTALEDVLLTGKTAKEPFTAKTGSFPTKGLREGPCAPLMPRLQALMLRVEAARPRRIALAAAERALALHRFAAAFLPRYHARKAARGWLDFDDLIARAGRLLSDRSVAQWVLFRLDGGIDHILVDEAQDTSPGQWAVIERLSEEFTAGEGAREGRRTLFVVGDKKQSIYSFQGADLIAFDRMRDQFAGRFQAVGAAMQDLTLDHSFRSAPAVLRVVDLAFDGREDRGIGGAPLHLAFKAEMPGRVDLWPLIPKAEREEPEAWDAPVDQLPQAHPAVQAGAANCPLDRRYHRRGHADPSAGGNAPGA
ncbi:double-strand break repair helicase AddA [Frigidibacter albus]